MDSFLREVAKPEGSSIRRCYKPTWYRQEKRRSPQILNQGKVGDRPPWQICGEIDLEGSKF